MKPNLGILADAPEFDRLAASRGARTKVARTGGRYGAGLISGVSVVTRGEALGHKSWIDQTAMMQVVAAINATTGIKSRFTHPGVSGDGLGSMLGHVIGPAVFTGNQVIADLHFLESAHKTPDGDLAKYVMDLAEETPADFGTSIVFLHDVEAEDAFEESHLQGGKFVSPDPSNANHYRHVRIRKLRAVDAVDSPAANPSGLFSRGQEIATDADALMAYALGLTTERPTTSALAVDPDRLAAYLWRFMEARNLMIAPKAKRPVEALARITPPPVDPFATASELAKPLPAIRATADRFADPCELVRPLAR